MTLESHPFLSNPDDPVQHRALYSSLCARVAPSSGTGTLQTISQVYKHLHRLTSYSPFIYFNKHREEHCCCSATQLCPTLYDPIDYSTPGFPVLHYLPELAQTHSIQWVMPSNRLILCCHPPLLPSIFPSTKVFCSELALCNLTSYTPVIYSNRHREEHIGHVSLA